MSDFILTDNYMEADMTDPQKTAKRQALGQDAMDLLFPVAEIMTEAELEPFYKGLEAAKDTMVCTYTDKAFDKDNQRFISVEKDGTIKVGSHDAMQFRAAREDNYFAPLSRVLEPITNRYTILKQQRLKQESVIAEAMAKVGLIVSLLERVNRIDNVAMGNDEFDVLTMELAELRGISKDDLNIYFEQRAKMIVDKTQTPIVAEHQGQAGAARLAEHQTEVAAARREEVAENFTMPEVVLPDPIVVAETAGGVHHQPA